MSDGTADSLDTANLTRRRGRYDADAVDRLFEHFKGEYQQLWKERERFRRRLDAAEEELGRFREIERSLGNALLVGEAAAADVRQKATRETEELITAARNEADLITAEARAEAERLLNKARTESVALGQKVAESETKLQEARKAYRSFLADALDALEAHRHLILEGDSPEVTHEEAGSTAPLPPTGKTLTPG